MATPQPVTPNPVREVWEKYRHLDRILTDEAFEATTFKQQLLKELWVAIRQQEAPK